MSVLQYDDFVKKNAGKKIVVIYGNCHTTSLRECLLMNDDFNREYAIFPIKAIQEIKKPTYFHQQCFKECDIFIHQSIQTKNRYGEEYSSANIMKQLKKDCLVIAIPNVYHLPKCFFPQYSEKREFTKKNGGTIFFRDAIIEEQVLRSKTISYNTILKKYLNQCLFTDTFIENEYDAFIKKVLFREGEWDIKVSNYFVNNRDRVSFFDPNHPTSSFIKYIALSILDFLGISCNLIDFDKELDSYEMPICESVVRHFNFNYDLKNKEFRKTGIKLLSSKMTLKTYIKQYCAFLWQDKEFSINVRIISKLLYLWYTLLNVNYKLFFKIKKVFFRKNKHDNCNANIN